jgi:S-adenosylmethionine:tRNA ribosyltransferase-isomerase
VHNPGSILWIQCELWWITSKSIAFSQLALIMQDKISPRHIQIEAFRYELPEDRIATHPLPERDAARLLIYRDGEIRESRYRELAAEIPEGYHLVFNNTRVVRARLPFRKQSGGLIEIFCLEPDERYPDITTAMATTGEVYWNCLVGGAAKWKNKQPLELKAAEGLHIEAHLEEKRTGSYLIRFVWHQPQRSFANVLELAGQVPIPPYIKRAADSVDASRYQTIYARSEGSVAAPTAGLHFTDHVMQQLKAKNIGTDMLTLHVGAGTFQPVKAERMEEHEMHAEFIEIDELTLEHIRNSVGQLIAVGTTSLRTLETLYWMGVKASLRPHASIEELSITQWEVYDELEPKAIEPLKALEALQDWMKAHNTKKLICKTRIMLAPGYNVRMIEGLITNFHQPQSTLLLLVAALIGDDWKKVYDYAMKNGFRFLSYGDGSLLWKKG